MNRREIPIVIRKSGEKSVAEFPVELEGGDELIVAREMAGSRVPAGEKWVISGYTNSGPVISKKEA